MRKQYDFRRAVPLYAKLGDRRAMPRQSGGVVVRPGREPQLTTVQVREIKNRVADLKDPIRYLLVNEMGPTFALYYNASDGLYAMNDPKSATLFKNRAAAVAVQRVLGHSVRVFRCTTRRSGGKRVFARLLR